MITEPQVPLFNLILAISYAMDLINPSVVDHHGKVAYIAGSITKEMNSGQDERNNLLIAGLLHDIGAFSLKERLEIMKFEMNNPSRHSELGYKLSKTFRPFADVADIIRFHHHNWNYGEGQECKGIKVPLQSHILHLADRVSVLVNTKVEVLGQVESIREKILKLRGKVFHPDVTDAFISLSGKEYFWLDIISPMLNDLLYRMSNLPQVEMNVESLMDLVKLFSRIIDFRSPFTATHSSGVAASAESLGKIAGFSYRECKMLKMAGYLHDLGKLAVPGEILEKPAKLSREEFNIIRRHTFYTYRILEKIGLIEILNTGAAFHHERLDGSGYPFHLDKSSLSLQARIFAIADVFTAITEDRPYRVGMNSEKSMKVLKSMADKNALDAELVSMLEENYDRVNSVRISAQLKAKGLYEAFWKEELQDIEQRVGTCSFPL